MDATAVGSNHWRETSLVEYSSTSAALRSAALSVTSIAYEPLPGSGSFPALSTMSISITGRRFYGARTFAPDAGVHPGVPIVHVSASAVAIRVRREPFEKSSAGGERPRQRPWSAGVGATHSLWSESKRPRAGNVEPDRCSSAPWGRRPRRRCTHSPKVISVRYREDRERSRRLAIVKMAASCILRQVLEQSGAIEAVERSLPSLIVSSTRPTRPGPRRAVHHARPRIECG